MTHKDPSSKQEKELEFLENMRKNQEIPGDKSIKSKDKDNRMQRKEDEKSITDYENQTLNKNSEIDPQQKEIIKKDVKHLEKSVKELGTFDRDNKYPPFSKKYEKIQRANEKAEVENKDRRARKKEIKKKGH